MFHTAWHTTSTVKVFHLILKKATVSRDVVVVDLRGRQHKESPAKKNKEIERKTKTG